jgi:hypothetical protein
VFNSPTSVQFVPFQLSLSVVTGEVPPKQSVAVCEPLTEPVLPCLPSFNSFTSVQDVPSYFSVLALLGLPGYPPKVIDASLVPETPAQDSLSLFKFPPLDQVPPGTGC